LTNVAGWDNSHPVETAPVSTTPRITGGDRPAVTAQRQGAAAAPAQQQPVAVQGEKRPEEPKEEKKGLFRRLWGVFK
jgi:hypothetical protein